MPRKVLPERMERNINIIKKYHQIKEDVHMLAKVVIVVLVVVVVGVIAVAVKRKK